NTRPPTDHDPRTAQPGANDRETQNLHAIHLREQNEPIEDRQPMPLLLALFAGVLGIGAALYFANNLGSLDPLAYDERYTLEMGDAAARGGGAKAAEDPIAQGKKLFAICATCHQASGAGLPGAYPPLAGSEWANGSEERVIRILLHGLTGELKVHGQTYNGNMPAFGPGGGYNWNDDKIAAVLTYVRQEWGNASAPISAEQVTTIRAKGAAGRTKPWTQPELEAIP
ncbi:MAG: cytochrome c, partial [Opitutaceae bacterium]|nr:cytochrome c [Opitutaceae bacterium]